MVTQFADGSNLVSAGCRDYLPDLPGSKDKHNGGFGGFQPLDAGFYCPPAGFTLAVKKLKPGWFGFMDVGTGIYYQYNLRVGSNGGWIA